ncbi:MAG: hypothetical protein ABJO67_03820 [Pseudoruegeria sp.]
MLSRFLKRRANHEAQGHSNQPLTHQDALLIHERRKAQEMRSRLLHERRFLRGS